MKITKLSSRGDTIIEVLIVLAVLSLAFSISLTTASRGLQQSRTAEEHAAATGLIQQQVEELRAAIADQNTAVFDHADSSSNPKDSFCMNSTTDQPTTNFSIPATYTGETNYGEYNSTCTSGFFNESITYIAGAQASDNYFNVRVRWPGEGSLGPQESSLVYKINALTANAISGVITAATAAQINIDVDSYTSNQTSTVPFYPGCSGNTVAAPDAGTSVTLNSDVGDSYTEGTTGGVASFSNLDYNHGYTATLNSAPSGYQTCNGNASVADLTTANSNSQLTGITVQPLCDQQTITENPVYGEVPYWQVESVLTGYYWIHNGPYVTGSPYNPSQVQPEVAAPYDPYTMGGNYPPYYDTPTTYPETGYEWVQNNYRANSDPNNYANYNSFNYNEYSSGEIFTPEEVYGYGPASYQIIGYTPLITYSCPS
jgi:type II secretory pathway pseudopilin PulG